MGRIMDDEIHPVTIATNVLGGLQRKLDSAGIPSWIGGGVGVDLLREKYLPDEAPRLHHDGDVYIPRSKRVAVIDLLAQREEVVIDYLPDCPEIIRTRVGLLSVDFISVDGDPDTPVVKKMTGEFRALSERRPQFPTPSSIPNAVQINPKPEYVEVGNMTLRVLDAGSLLAIDGLTNRDEPKRNRDRRVLGQIINKLEP